jgi:hypothetical protein
MCINAHLVSLSKQAAIRPGYPYQFQIRYLRQRALTYEALVRVCALINTLRTGWPSAVMRAKVWGCGYSVFNVIL